MPEAGGLEEEDCSGWVAGEGVTETGPSGGMKGQGRAERGEDGRQLLLQPRSRHLRAISLKSQNSCMKSVTRSSFLKRTMRLGEA